MNTIFSRCAIPNEPPKLPLAALMNLVELVLVEGDAVLEGVGVGVGVGVTFGSIQPSRQLVFVL